MDDLVQVWTTELDRHVPLRAVPVGIVVSSDMGIRSVEYAACRCKRLCRKREPVSIAGVLCSAELHPVLTEVGITAMADTPAVQFPLRVRIVNHAAVLVAPVPTEDLLGSQEIRNLGDHFRVLFFEPGERLMM